MTHVLLHLCVSILLFNHSQPMGVDVALISRERGDVQISYHEFSREFGNFIAGPDAYAHSEFQQIEEKLGLDLSLFRSFPINLEDPTDELQYKKYLAEKDGDVEKARQIEEEIKKVYKEWEENYESITEGWIKVDELEQLTQTLIVKLEEHRNLHKELAYNYEWEHYFVNDETASKKEKNPIDYTLIEDVTSLLTGLELMRQHCVVYVAFQYG